MATAVAHQVYIGIGSNLGKKKDNFLRGARPISEASRYENPEGIFSL